MNTSNSPELKLGSGQCYLCGKEVTARRYLGRHLWSCLNIWEFQCIGADEEESNIYAHVTVSSGPNYWMDLVVRQDATLRQLDQFLRDTWLECCNHLSAFMFGEMMAGCDEMDDDLRNSLEDIDTSFLANFDTPYIRTALPGATIKHEYDFGATTETTISTVYLYQLPEVRPIVAVARNNPTAANPANSPRWGVCDLYEQDLIQPPTPSFTY